MQPPVRNDEGKLGTVVRADSVDDGAPVSVASFTRTDLPRPTPTQLLDPLEVAASLLERIAERDSPKGQR